MSAHNLYPVDRGRATEPHNVSNLTIAPDQGLRSWDLTPSSMYERLFKRPLDLMAASVLLVVTAPIMAGTALAIRFRMGKGVLFRQHRVGRGSEPFVIVKFRTMHHDRRQDRRPAHPNYGGEERRETHKTVDDPRHTNLGRIIRKYALDELPQLWNVLKGDMSLVGPRPEIYGVAVRNQILNHVRHRVRPGITGPWQLSTDRSNFIHENLSYDESYVERVTFRGDVGLLLRTLQMFRHGEGA